MMTPNAIETKGGNWEPIVVHPERLCPYRNEHFPRHLCRKRQDAIAYAERVIVGRLCFNRKERENLETADNSVITTEYCISGPLFRIIRSAKCERDSGLFRFIEDV